jgi:D-arabinose 1-dehydrogenase-like Zn-dependent alcohol dehydrogenase
VHLEGSIGIDEIAEAHSRLDHGKRRGKLVLDMEGKQ